jgi:hypothetical protein
MDATTIASLATAGGTLVLALATFSSTRSANRAARVAERSFLAAQRPLLFQARPDDPPQKVGFADDRWLVLRDGLGAVDVGDEAIYMAMPLRNVAAGIAVLHGWHLDTTRVLGNVTPHEPDEFRMLTRDLYIPSGDVGFWQGALRDRSDPLFAELRDAVTTRRAMTIDLLYGDHEGAQRTITRFSFTPRIDSDTDSIAGWYPTVGRHWPLDRAGPR